MDTLYIYKSRIHICYQIVQWYKYNMPIVIELQQITEIKQAKSLRSQYAGTAA